MLPGGLAGESTDPLGGLFDELHVYSPGGYYGRYIRGQGGYKTITKGSKWGQ